MSTEIPTIDLKDARQGTNITKVKTTARELHKALQDIGFIYIKNHGVSEELQSQLFSSARDFFSEDEEKKLSIAMIKAGRAWRGYFPVGTEFTSGIPDQKEGIYFGTEHTPDSELVQKQTPMHGANLWPEGKKYLTFKNQVTSYMESMQHLAQLLMELVSLGLGLSEDYFKKRFEDHPTTLFRIFHYPSQNNSNLTWGVGEHTDMGFLTILLQDHLGGLEVQRRDGRWVSAPPIPGTLVVNIGDMLQHWTHGIYKANLHRVRNTSNQGRLSLPYFYDPSWQASLKPIEKSALRNQDLERAEIQSAARDWDGLEFSSLNENVSYGEFVWEKISKVFPDLAGKDACK